MGQRPLTSPLGHRTWSGDGGGARGAVLARLAAVAVPSGALAAQGAAGAPPDAMSATMNAVLTGMVILMIPAFFICTGVTILAIRKRRQWRERETGRPGAPAWESPGDAEDEPWR